MGIGSIAGALFHVVGPELANLAVDAIVRRKSKNAGAKDGDVEAAPAPEVPGEERQTLALLVGQLEAQRASGAALAERLSRTESDLAATRAALGQVEARLRAALLMGAVAAAVSLGALGAVFLG